MRAGNEARVGLVVVLATALALAGYFFLRGVAPGADKYYLRINGPANIAPGNDVRLQGVKIGQVQKVTLDPETQKPLLTLAVQPSKLLKNYQYTIRTNSLIGEPYLDISGVYNPDQNYGPSEMYAANNPSQIISGRAQTNVADLADQAGTISEDFRITLKKLNVTIDRINKGVLSYENQVKLTRALEGVTKLTQQAGKSFGNEGVKIGFGDARAQENLNRTLENAALAAQEARLTARGINNSVSGLSRSFGDVTRSVGGVTRGLEGVVGENRGQLRGLLTNLNSTAKNVSGLTESLNFVVKQSGFQENSQLAFRSLRRAAENVEAGTAGFKAIGGDPKTQQNLRDTVDALRVTTESLASVAKSINETLNDPLTQGTLKSTLATLAGTASNLEKATANLNEITAGFKNIVGDPQVQQNLKETAANLNGTLAATRAAAERVNALLGGRKPRSVPASDDSNESDEKSSDVGAGQKRDGKNRKVALGTTLPSGFDFTFRHLDDSIGSRRDSDSSRKNFGDVHFNAELFGAPLRLGVSNIGEGSDLTLQSGRFIGRNAAIRYGIYRSKLGVGAELRQGRFSLEGNLYDPNRRGANAYVGFAITPRIEVLAGREKLGGMHSNSIGVRLRQ